MKWPVGWVKGEMSSDSCVVGLGVGWGVNAGEGADRHIDTDGGENLVLQGGFVLESATDVESSADPVEGGVDRLNSSASDTDLPVMVETESTSLNAATVLLESMISSINELPFSGSPSSSSTSTGAS